MKNTLKDYINYLVENLTDKGRTYHNIIVLTTMYKGKRVVLATMPSMSYNVELSDITIQSANIKLEDGLNIINIKEDNKNG